MPPLLKPTECSVLVLDSAGEPGNPDNDVVAGRDRILQAASLCGVPAFRAARQQPDAPADALLQQPIYSPPMPGSPTRPMASGNMRASSSNRGN